MVSLPYHTEMIAPPTMNRLQALKYKRFKRTITVLSLCMLSIIGSWFFTKPEYAFASGAHVNPTSAPSWPPGDSAFEAARSASNLAETDGYDIVVYAAQFGGIADNSFACFAKSVDQSTSPVQVHRSNGIFGYGSAMGFQNVATNCLRYVSGAWSPIAFDQQLIDLRYALDDVILTPVDLHHNGAFNYNSGEYNGIGSVSNGQLVLAANYTPPSVSLSLVSNPPYAPGTIVTFHSDFNSLPFSPKFIHFYENTETGAAIDFVVPLVPSDITWSSYTFSHIFFRDGTLTPHIDVSDCGDSGYRYGPACHFMSASLPTTITLSVSGALGPSLSTNPSIPFVFTNGGSTPDFGEGSGFLMQSDRREYSINDIVWLKWNFNPQTFTTHKVVFFSDASITPVIMTGAAATGSGANHYYALKYDHAGTFQPHIRICADSTNSSSCTSTGRLIFLGGGTNANANFALRVTGNDGSNIIGSGGIIHGSGSIFTNTSTGAMTERYTGIFGILTDFQGFGPTGNSFLDKAQTVLIVVIAGAVWVAQKIYSLLLLSAIFTWLLSIVHPAAGTCFTIGTFFHYSAPGVTGLSGCISYSTLPNSNNVTILLQYLFLEGILMFIFTQVLFHRR